jgi:hypothetical protein
LPQRSEQGFYLVAELDSNEVWVCLGLKDEGLRGQPEGGGGMGAE